MIGHTFNKSIECVEYVIEKLKDDFEYWLENHSADFLAKCEADRIIEFMNGEYLVPSKDIVSLLENCRNQMAAVSYLAVTGDENAMSKVLDYIFETEREDFIKQVGENIADGSVQLNLRKLASDISARSKIVANKDHLIELNHIFGTALLASAA